MDKLSDSSSISISMSSDNDTDSSDEAVNVVNEFQTPKRKYKRAIHHGLNESRAKYYKRSLIHGIPQQASLSIHDCDSDDETSLDAFSLSSIESELSLSISDLDSVESDMDSDSSPSSMSESEDDFPSKTDLNTPLYDGCKHTEQSSYTMIMLFVMKHSLSKEAFSDLIMLVSSHLPESPKFSKSVYKMKETLKSTVDMKDATVHYYCEDCQAYSASDDVCDKVLCRRNHAKMLEFHDLHMEEQLKSMFKDDVFLNLIKQQAQRTPNEKYCDIVDGEVYKNTKKNIQDGADLYLTFTMNTDGVALFSSSKKGSLWPVYVAINELPIELRFTRKYLIPCYLHCQAEKPNMLTYLMPLMEVLKRLHSTGIVVETSDGKMVVKAHLIAVCLDLPARALVSNMKQFNGKSSCSLCLDEGNCEQGNPLHRFFPFQNESTMRTHESMLHDAEEASRNGTSVNGIKGASPLQMLDYIDLPKTFVVDWMHCILLGVTKSLMGFWFDSKHKNNGFFIGNKMSLLNKRLLKIQIPDFVSRRQRALDDYKHWKASECREWLIHFSMPVLLGVLDPTPFVHYLLLVTAMCLLTKNGMTAEDIDYAENLLKGFCEIYPRIYGRKAQTMNVHLLRHLAYFCRLYGPLYAYSCFGFESMNSYIKKMVHGTRHVNSQVCFAVGMSKQMARLVRKFTTDADDIEIRELAKQLGSKIMLEKKVIAGEDKILGRIQIMKPTSTYFDLLSDDMRESSPYTFMRLQRGDGTFFCKDYQSAKTRNSYTVAFVNEYNEEKYGFILCFLLVNRSKYAVVEVCQTEEFALDENVKMSVTDDILKTYLVKQLCPHAYRVTSHQRRVIIPVNSLCSKCVLLEINPEITFISPLQTLLNTAEAYEY